MKKLPKKRRFGILYEFVLDPHKIKTKLQFGSNPFEIFTKLTTFRMKVQRTAHAKTRKDDIF